MKRLDLSNNELPSVLNEVCLLQQLDHPNIIKYHEYFKENSKFCIVMEYADNGDLYGQVYEAKKNRIHISEATVSINLSIFSYCERFYLDFRVVHTIMSRFIVFA